MVLYGSRASPSRPFALPPACGQQKGQDQAKPEAGEDGAESREDDADEDFSPEPLRVPGKWLTTSDASESGLSKE